MAPTLASGAICTPTTPSAATRVDALAALLPSLTRRISSALPRSPAASVKAFLHSIIGASVFSRSSFTMLAVTSAMLAPESWLIGCATARRPSERSLCGGPVSRLFHFDEFVGHGRDHLMHRLGPPFQNGVRDAAGVQPDCAAGIVVSRNHVIDAVRRVVGVHHADHGYAELSGFG